jgi:hypothetical protein
MWTRHIKPLPAGRVVSVVPANNLPYEDCFWVDTPELEHDPYGILLVPGDYQLLDEAGENET